MKKVWGVEQGGGIFSNVGFPTSFPRFFGPLPSFPRAVPVDFARYTFRDTRDRTVVVSLEEGSLFLDRGIARGRRERRGGWGAERGREER